MSLYKVTTKNATKKVIEKMIILNGTEKILKAADHSDREGGKDDKTKLLGNEKLRARARGFENR